MKKFTITNSDNQSVNVDLVRYFKFKNDLFLIYTMNEIDEKNYIKLYLVRIMEELGFPVVQTIRNDADWALMQGIVKKVLKEIKSGKRKQLEDLDYSDIMGIKVVNPRYFKLEPKLADILASNYLESGEYENDDIDITVQNNIFDATTSEILEETLNDTITSEQINVNQELVTLESIDETIEKEGKFEPKLAIKNDYASMPSMLENDIDDKVSNNESNTDILTKSIRDNVDSSVTENKNDIVNNNDVLDRLNIVEEKNDITLEPVQEYVSTSLNNNEQNISEINNKIENIDYKNLYIAVKKENETSAALIDSLMNQLQKYQEKYGSLEEESQN